ncbi:MAG: type II toxin-antitoxin system VapC family toxin [Terriglobia bacterium]|jgi:predicted nucleic acid-binding protein
MNLVVDASVAAKWLFLEPDTGKARAILDSAERGELELLAPEILLAEIANSLWKRTERSDLDRASALGLFDGFQKVEFKYCKVQELIGSAMSIAFRHHHPVYDCLYVVLARREDCDLVTADERLYRAFEHDCPWVRLLRNFSWD